MKIGILGGTFNPVHNAHLKMAQSAFKKLNLDVVYFVPTYMPPHKRLLKKISVSDRVSMLRSALKGMNGLSLCLFEVNQKTVSYTIDTLKYFRKRFGKKADLFFLVGSDSANKLHTWKDYKKLLKLATFVVFKRPKCTITKNKELVQNIDFKQMDIASRKIREKGKNSKILKKQVPEPVLNYIQQKELY